MDVFAVPTLEKVITRTSEGRRRGKGHIGGRRRPSVAFVMAHETTSAGVLFRLPSRDCFVERSVMRMITNELRRISFDRHDPAWAIADTLDAAALTGEVGPLPRDDGTAVLAVVERLSALDPNTEALATLRVALALDYET